jgi:hypothetical protein
MAESHRQRRIRKALRKRFGEHSKFFKCHGGPFTEAGLPDIMGGVHGLFFGFEVKEPDGVVSEIQLVQRDEFLKAGVVCEIIETEDQAISLVEHALKRSKISCALCTGKGRIRPLH